MKNTYEEEAMLESEDICREEPFVDDFDDADLDSNDPCNDELSEVEEVDLSDFSPSQSVSCSRRIGEAGVLTIVKSRRNGKRVVISDTVLQRLKDPEKVQISLKDTCIAIGEKLPGCINSYAIRKSGNKGMLYSGALVQEIANKFRLDFSSRTSITFGTVKFVKSNNYIVALIEVTH